MHCYGLTETTVSSTFFRLDPTDPVIDWPNLPIGSPLPSADLRVLDHRLRPVPVGGIGELYIGGVGVGRGYLGQPGLTAQRFLADPDPARRAQRLYRTGDLVRQRADGNLEFISRVDRQVKIRGFRVEPLEIESVLSRHPGVAETVVSVHEPAPGDRRLIAYVVPGPDGMPAVAELRRYLDGELPAYLVPSAFVELDAIPLTSNGKVDRDRLPVPDGRPADSGRGVPGAGVAGPAHAGRHRVRGRRRRARSASPTTSSRSVVTPSWRSRSSPGPGRPACGCPRRTSSPTRRSPPWPRWPAPDPWSMPSRPT